MVGGDDLEVPSPFLIVQLSDLHIGADWGGRDPDARLAAAVESVRAIRPQPDVALVTGDLAEHGTDAEYERVAELLSPLPMPIYVLAGNHDDRAALRRHFLLPGADAGPICYSVDLGPLRLVVLDSTIPGVDSGELDGERLAWLKRELAASPEQPVLIAMHHPPLLIGVPAWDKIGLADEDRLLLGEVVQRHPQVRRIVAGHVHRTIAGELAGRSVLTVPSTYAQSRLEFGSWELEFTLEPAGFALHAVLDGEVSSHLQPVA